MHLTMDPVDDRITIAIISGVSLVTLVSVLAFCLCCRRRNPKSELAGVEGIVKLKHLDDSHMTVSIDTTDSSDALNPKTKLTQKNATLPLDAKLNGYHEYELKRSSANAPHRSLPDIPIVETVCDNNSELYATVGDKPQGKSPSNTKKLANISQHSSMSQADDATSPYARVRHAPAHAYDKLKKTEHPYAQVVQPATAGGIAQVVLENDDDDDDDEDETTIENPISHRESSSNHDLLNPGGSSIDASAAISGRISASQELPYMTPPIVPVMPPPQQHFSGDSQDSSKGYTSISVREPLANIIAQTNQQNAQRRRREIQDSHYAMIQSVSDDSDEMYAAIEDPNLYTSGSETYAQIQAPMTVSVEINPTAPPPTQQLPSTSQAGNRYNRMSSSSHPVNHTDEVSNATAEALKNLHSRQASSSSCTSSVGNIGSPKPEKRQANSPLPPTPKSQHQSRNSTSSILEYHEGAKIKDSNNNSSKVKQSPSKDLEGMYAKVMKKNKLSSVPSENSSPILPRHEPTVNDVTDGISEAPVKLGNEYETIDKKRTRTRNSEMSDAGYETIPADRNNNKEAASDYQSIPNSSPHYAQIGDKPVPKAKMSLFQETEYDPQLDSIDDPKYETLKLDTKVQTKGPPSNATDSDYDPNYEIVMTNNQQKTASSSSSTLVDDGYSQIGKKSKDVSDDESIPGYSTIKKPEPDYSSIKGEHLGRLPENSINDLDIESNIYSSIPAVVQTVVTPSTDSNSSELTLDYDGRTSTTNSIATPTTVNNNYESLSNSESTTLEEPNYESMKYLRENPYERLHNDKSSSSPDPSGDAVSPLSEHKSPNGAVVDDFFKV